MTYKEKIKSAGLVETLAILFEAINEFDTSGKNHTTDEEYCGIAVDMRDALYEASDGKHLCSTCIHFPPIGDTTQDTHPCDLVFEMLYGEKANIIRRGEYGNSNVFKGGFETEDNGSGFWVTRCPHWTAVR